MFQVYLMYNAGIRRYDPEVVEGLLAPLEEGISFTIAGEFNFGVFCQRGTGAKDVHLHGMVNDKLCRRQRIDFSGIAAELTHGITHRGKIDDCRNAGEVLQQHPRRHVGDFVHRFGVSIPVRQLFDIGGSDCFTVFTPEQIFQQYLQRVGQAGNISRSRIKAETGIFPVMGLQAAQRMETIQHGRSSWSIRY